MVFTETENLFYTSEDWKVYIFNTMPVSVHYSTFQRLWLRYFKRDAPWPQWQFGNDVTLNMYSTKNFLLNETGQY